MTTATISRPRVAPTRARNPTRTKARAPTGPTPRLRAAAATLKQASDPTRLQILMLLAAGGRHVGGLCEDLGIPSQPAVSHHLALMRHGRLIEARRQGKRSVYSLTEQGRTLAAIVDQVVG